MCIVHCLTVRPRTILRCTPPPITASLSQNEVNLGQPLIPLNASIRLTILAQPIILSWLVVITTTASRGLAASRAASLTALAAGLDGVDLAAGKLVVQALIGLAVLAKTVVL